VTMSAAEIVRYLIREGYGVKLDPDREHLQVEPKLATEDLRDRVLARKADILAYLRELDAAPVAQHPFTTVASADLESVRENGVCIACGCPWPLHGDPPLEFWRFVANANEVALIEAAAIVAVAAATRSTEDVR